MNPKQFAVEVDGIGNFTFAWRTMRHEFAVQAEYSRLTEGVATPSQALEMLAGIVSQLKVLTLEAPADWDISSMDPLDDEVYAKLVKVHAAMRAKEGSFRRPKSATGGPATGQGNVAVDGVHVSPSVQPAAD